MTPAATVRQVFGSASAVARVLGLTRQAVSYWSTHCYGVIPREHHTRLLEAALARDMTLSAADLTQGRPDPGCEYCGRWVPVRVRFCPKCINYTVGNRRKEVPA